MTTRQILCLSSTIEICISKPTNFNYNWQCSNSLHTVCEELRLYIDCHLTENAHVSTIVRICYFELRRQASITRFLTSTATARLVSAFVWSRIDNCGELLLGSTHGVTSHLQQMRNFAALVILRLPMSSNIATH